MIYLVSLLSIIIISLIIVENRKPKYNHIEPVHYLDSTVIIVDNFTAHRLRFKNDNKHVKFTYNKEEDNYILTIYHFSENHKKKILTNANLL